MIDFIEGTVESKAPGELVISAGGVGFLLLCSNATLAEAPAKGEKWRCYSVLNVREDAMELFGFYSREEKRMFERLRSVSGVGPRMALSILSSMPLNDLSIALVAGDAAALCAKVKNVFEQVLPDEQRARIEDIKRALLASGAECAAMTGSGSAVFGLFREEDICRAACSVLRSAELQTFCTIFV